MKSGLGQVHDAIERELRAQAGAARLAPARRLRIRTLHALQDVTLQRPMSASVSPSRRAFAPAIVAMLLVALVAALNVDSRQPTSHPESALAGSGAAPNRLNVRLPAPPSPPASALSKPLRDEARFIAADARQTIQLVSRNLPRLPGINVRSPDDDSQHLH